MISGITDKIPHDQEIIDIAHLLNRIELIFQAGLQLFGTVAVTLIQSLITELVQVFPRSIWRWHIEAWQLGHAKFDLHMASFAILCVFQVPEAHMETALPSAPAILQNTVRPHSA